MIAVAGEGYTIMVTVAGGGSGIQRQSTGGIGHHPGRDARDTYC